MGRSRSIMFWSAVSISIWARLAHSSDCAPRDASSTCRAEACPIKATSMLQSRAVAANKAEKLKSDTIAQRSSDASLKLVPQRMNQTHLEPVAWLQHPLPSWPSTAQAIHALVVLVVFLAACRFTKMDDRDASATLSWTGIRAFVAQWVISEHIYTYPVPACGGGLFIVLSGCIFGLDQQRVTTLCDYARFLGRRAIRIYPAYWAYLVTTDCVKHHGRWRRIVQEMIGRPFKMWALTDQWLPGRKENTFLWFLSTILALYALCPLFNLLLGRLGTRSSPKSCLLVASCCYMLQVVLYILVVRSAAAEEQWLLYRQVFGVTVAVFTNPICRVPQFVLGMAIGHCSQQTMEMQANDSARTDRSHKCYGEIPTDAAALTLICVAFVYSQSQYLGYSVEAWRLATRMNLVSPAFALLLLGLATGREFSFTRMVLTRPLVVKVGQMSYGTYLWHIFLTRDCHLLRVHSVWSYTVLYAYVYLCGYLSFHFVENPAMQLEKRISRRSRSA